MNDMFNLDRRGLLERALLLAGGAAAAGLSGPALAKAAARPKPYLDAPTFALLSAVADTFVPRTDTPGAVDARVPALFDALLANWASGERRVELTGALTAIDRLARAKEGKGFAELAPDARKALLIPHDVEALKVVPRTKPIKGLTMMAGPAYADPAYGKLKELIVVLYYTTEIALTQELTYVHAPGEWQPSIPVTPATRPAAGGQF